MAKNKINGIQKGSGDTETVDNNVVTEDVNQESEMTDTATALSVPSVGNGELTDSEVLNNDISNTNITPAGLEIGEVADEDKVSSVTELNDRAKIDDRINTDTDDKQDSEEDTFVDTTVDKAIVDSEETTLIDMDSLSTKLSAIVKGIDTSLFDKITLIADILPDVGGKVIRSLKAMHSCASKASTRTEINMNREQKAIVRAMMKLLSEKQEIVSFNMKYINWVFKQLTDKVLLDKEDLGLVKGMAPIDTVISTMFIAGKDDKELATYVYLLTYLDVKANAKTQAEKEKKVDMNKITADTLLTEDVVNKLNTFYAM